MRRNALPQCLAVLLLLAAGSTASAQFRLGIEIEPLVEPRFDVLDNAPRSHLDRVEQLLADGQVDEAVEIIRRVMETDGDKLLQAVSGKEPTPASFRQYYPVRHAAQLRLARMASTYPEGLALYRTRVDRVAERRLQEALAARDAAALARVTRDFLCSSYGDDALWKLGELALERGDYALARESWERLSPLTRTPVVVNDAWPVPPGRPLWLALRGMPLDERWPQIEAALTTPAGELNWLAFPDTDLPLAEIRARLALVSIMEGSRQRAQIEIDVLRRLHPDAPGKIGGRSGKLVDLLTALLEQSAAWPAPPAAGVWPTLAGAPSRARFVAHGISLGEKELWHIDLPAVTSDRDLIGAGRPRVAEDHRGLFSYHPVVWNDIVIVPEHTQIRALKLSSGAPAWAGGAGDGVIYRAPLPADDDEREYVAAEPHPRSRPYVGVARFTATLHGDKLFARMGSRLTMAAEPNPAASEQQGIIVGLDLAAQGRMLRGFPLKPEAAEWNFEGTPITDGVGLYIAMRRHDAVNAQTHVACYDLASGEMKWRRWVCSASTPGHGLRDEISHALLTLSDGAIYYNTHHGAIAKLSTASGAILWATQYPRGAFPNQDPDRRDRHFFRDLTPCLVQQGMVVCAPSDSETIFALDAASGQLIWSTPPEIASDAVHLLGIQQGNVVASGDYLYWFDLFTGRFAGQFPPPQKDAPGFGLPTAAGYGRGIIAGEQVYFPTRERMHVFAPPQTGGIQEPLAKSAIDLAPRDARGGNVIVAGDKVVIAGSKKLQVFENKQ